MTNQELFDRVCAHLAQQGRRSRLATANGCAYRGAVGLKCAIGALIPDELYSPDLEGHTTNCVPVLRAAGLSDEQADLAFSVQRAHDLSRNAQELRTMLLDAAAVFGLDPAAAGAIKTWEV